jgi:hypothetical protein
MAFFQTKNPNLGEFRRIYQFEDVGIFFWRLVYFTAISYIFGHLLYYMVIWYIFPRFGMLYQEKSGNPGQGDKTSLWKKIAQDVAKAKFCLINKLIN